MAYEINWDNATWAYREWGDSDKARLAGELFAEVDPTKGNCRAFIDAAGESNCGELSERIYEVYGGGGLTGKE